MNIDRRLIRLAASTAGLFGRVVGMGLLGGLLLIGQAWWLSQAVNGVFFGGMDVPALMRLVIGLLALILLRSLAAFLTEGLASRFGRDMGARLRRELLEHMVRLGPAYVRGEQTSDLGLAALQGVDELERYFSQYLPQVFWAAMIPLAILAAVFPRDPLSGLVLVLTAPLIPVFMVLIGKLAERHTRQQWTALRRMSAFFLDTLQGLTTLKLLGRSDQAGRIAVVGERYRQTTMSVLRVAFLSALVLEFIGTISTAIVAVQIGLRLLYGGIEFQPAFFILLLAPEFYAPLRQLGVRFHASMSGLTAAEKIYQVLDAQPEVDLEVNPGRPHLPCPPFSIRFEQVSYCYPSREQAAVQDLSFELRPGQLSALVGSSGTGKTTVTQLLLRFIDPQQGRILVNEVPLNDLPLADWRRQVAWVPQRPALFTGTIAENLRIACPEASEEQLRQAVRQAQLEDYVDSLPHGLDTMLGEGGKGLSGGQAQRLAIARAFLRDAPLVIFDEPTAYLDAEQEAMIEAAIQRLRQGRTLLIVAHRLPTVLHADQILVMQAGRIVEQGRHEQLARGGGLYAGMLGSLEVEP